MNMVNSKLFILLRTLSRKEFLAFKKHLNTHCEKQKVALTVFSFLESFYPAFRHEKLNKKTVYEQVFGPPYEEKACKTKLLNSMSDIYKELKKFMMLQRLENNDIDMDWFWAEILMERSLAHELERQVSVLRERIENKPHKKLTDYLKGLAANYLQYYWVIQEKHKPDIDAVEQSVRYLDHYYTIIRLKLACEMASRKKMLNAPPDEYFQDFLLEKLNPALLKEDPIIALYYTLYHLITTGDTEKFYSKAESLLRIHKDDIDKEELLVMLSYLQNHAFAEVREGNTKFLTKIHELDKFGVQQKLFTLSGLISPPQFSNIINTACKVEAFDWAHKFIKTHTPYLAKEYREPTSKLAYAMIAYEKKEFDKTLGLLNELQIKDVHQAVRSKSLKLICFYEINENATLILHNCNSFSSYLRQSKRLKGDVVPATLNFISIIRKLVRKKGSRDAIIREIDRTKHLYYRLWLREKALLYEE